MTLLNLAFGVISLMLTMSGDFRWAALMVIGSLVADGLDGRLARMLKADGEFGKELDSLADLVAFGTAPALLMHQLVLYKLGYYGAAVAIVFPMCGALRLARFNIVKTSGFFMGVPITAAGTLLSTLSFYALQDTTQVGLFLFPVVVLVLAYLMVSTIPYPDFKKRLKKDARVSPWPFVGPLLVVLAVLKASGWNPWALVLLPLTIYVVLGPWLLILKKWAEKVQPWLARDGQ
jgi:CDP-diacylglycerol--serine O-phosphatidyltransferase